VELYFHSPTCLYGIHRDYFTSVFRQNNKSKYDKNKNDNNDDNINEDNNSQGGVCGLLWLSQKTSLLQSSQRYQKDGNVVLSSVGSIWDVLMHNFAATISHLKVTHPCCVFGIIRSIMNSNTKIYFQNQVSYMSGLIFNHHQAKLQN
jgi:hypothetical protein